MFHSSTRVIATMAVSTQETFGRVLTALADDPEVGRRLVTTSPDVSVSTNLGGWINKMGVFSSAEQPDYLRATEGCCAGSSRQPVSTSSWGSAR